MDELVEKAKNGSTAAFMAIMEGIKEQLYKTAYTKLQNEHDSLDVVQETISKAFSNIRQLKQNRFFKTWVIRILLNECSDMNKHRKKVVPVEKEWIELKKLEDTRLMEKLEMESMLSHLDEIYKEVVDLRYNHELKLDEIAEMLKIPVGTVKSRLNTAHKLLRKQYNEKEVAL